MKNTVKNTPVISNISNETALANQQEPAKKYEFTGETIEVGDYTLYRIRALRDFANIKAGDLGGFIHKVANLAHNGDCWVGGNAMVYGDARIYDNAHVSDNAKITGSAKIYENARVYGNASVHIRAEVYGNAQVYENALIYGDIFGHAKVYGNAKIYDTIYGKFLDKTRIYGNAEVYDKARVLGTSQVYRVTLYKKTQ
ncbi:hypothetical protein [Bartonella sp. AP57NXGY]|uniref:hypothetical protein n=1 Tax=Bartonella sp. AP57NXGY TaxID=3243497 RepID=UPI0035CF5BF3